MTILYNVSDLAAKIEAAPGTPESLAAADAVFRAYDVIIQPEIPITDRMGQGFLSRIPAIPGVRFGRATFRTDLIGGSSAPAWMTTLLPATGWVAQTGGYYPRSAAPGAAVKTLTIGGYSDGRFQQLAGCAGNWRLPARTGEATFMEWDFLGIFTAPSDVSIITPTKDTLPPLRFAGGTFSLGGSSRHVSECTLESGNEIIMLPTPTTVSGGRYAVIHARRVNGSMDPEAALSATKNWHTDLFNLTESALSVVIGSSGNQLTIAAPKLQLTNVPHAVRDGVLVDRLEFQCNRNAGDDELTFASA